MKTIKKGDKGSEVKQLQRVLHLEEDGIFGSVTEEAVKAFQKDKGLKVDGIVGVNTWRLLLNDVSPQTKRKVNTIILHCTATKDGVPVTVEQIDKFHKANGWSGIGYHYVIYLDGSIHKGRDESKSGAHCEGHNANSIGISYVGGLDKNGKPKDTRTKEQKESMYKLVKELMDKYKLGLTSVRCHNEFSSKACPSFKKETFHNEYIKYIG